MTIHPVQEDTAQAGQATSYDSVWAEVPTQPQGGLERVMLSDEKIFVVLAVVLIIWFGLALFLLRTDRKIDRLERQVDEGILGES